MTAGDRGQAHKMAEIRSFTPWGIQMSLPPTSVARTPPSSIFEARPCSTAYFDPDGHVVPVPVCSQFVVPVPVCYWSESEPFSRFQRLVARPGAVSFHTKVRWPALFPQSHNTH